MTQDYRIPVWLDCDPGQDDIVAITLAANNPQINLVGISTVHGNSSLKNTTRNCLQYLTAIKKTGIPVFPGSPIPLQGDPSYCPEVHGSTGLNGSELLPEPIVEPQDENKFYGHLCDVINRYENEITICAIGPLTNIALFFKKYPDYRSKIKFLSIMGGAFETSNYKKAAEFNISCDMFAAREVFNDPILSSKVVLAPLDLTRKVVANAERREKLLGEVDKQSTSLFRSLVYQLLTSMYERIKLRRGEDYEGPSLHDPVAIAVLLHMYNLDGKLEFSYAEYPVDVITEGELEGATIKASQGPCCKVLNKMNVEHFWNLIFDAYDAAEIIASR